MKEGQPSRTAFAVARRRALHQTVDGGSIFKDPLAWRILGDDPPTDPLEIAVAGQDERPLRLFIATRHRIAENAVATAYELGARQAIVLGAGLDTFAYRHPHAGLRVFEVDFPATQQWKRERLAEAGIDATGVTFVGVDFMTDDLGAKLRDAGFDPSQPSAVMWLGVTYYLTPDAVAATLRTLGSFTRTTVVFDYGLPDDSPERKKLLKRVAALGEPFLGTFTPAQVADFGRDAGFTSREDHAIGDNARAHVAILGT